LEECSIRKKKERPMMKYLMNDELTVQYIVQHLYIDVATVEASWWCPHSGSSP
jgi:hypothetical protein